MTLETSIRTGVIGPSFSVIVPMYNAEHYLSECVDSLLKQTYTDFEVILVDDGSTDRGGQLADEYARNDMRIRVIHRANGGVSSARNTGLDAAVGANVMFVDADDTVEPKMLELFYGAVSSGEYDVAISLITRDMSPVQDEIETGRREVIRSEAASCLLEYYVCSHPFSSPCGNCYSREVILRSGARFPEGQEIGEDDMFNLSFFAAARNGVILHFPLYHYRLVEGSATNRYRPELFDAYLKIDESRRMAVLGMGPKVDTAVSKYMAIRYANCFIKETSEFCIFRDTERFSYLAAIIKHPYVQRALSACGELREMAISQRIVIPPMRARMPILAVAVALAMKYLRIILRK